MKNDPRETVIQRNRRLRALVLRLSEENERLRELDKAWASCCESLRTRIREGQFQEKIRHLKMSRWQRLKLRLHIWKVRWSGVKYRALD